ncbi:chromosome partitioning protein ParA [Vibrio profundi]|uniref:chromosome partitioning protein ParA n=1 Tax=Vibrio profundi TaxID=1774960 RepID=UPI003735BA09
MKQLILLFSIMSLTMTPALANKEATQKTGYFIDSPVTGLYYETSSQISGVTNKGAFQYAPGDIISFFIGNDSSGYLLTTLSAQEVITPTLSTTKPSKSINMTRLLLSLDETPENREEIRLASKVLSDSGFQTKLKHLDLNYLDDTENALNLDLVSAKEAVEHLRDSQAYIKENFTSEEIVFSPKNIKMSNVLIMKKDIIGKICVLDLKYINNPRYTGPIGELDYKITDTELIQYPGTGDYFNGCHVVPSKAIKEILREPRPDFTGWSGLFACADTGCTRSDLSGFAVEDYDDEGDWKYRTIALDFDPSTQLLMEKIQGLGRSEKVHHDNKQEMIWFTYPEGKGDNISYEGTWQLTQYQQDQIVQQCLNIRDRRVYLAPNMTEQCPSELKHYSKDVTDAYGDMWWFRNQTPHASLAQMNTLVRWYDATSQGQFTSWEYLPAGQQWDEGILYRFRQTISRNNEGSYDIHTFSVSELKKVQGES